MIPEFSVELGNREQGTGNREEGFQYVPSSVQKSNRSPIYLHLEKRKNNGLYGNIVFGNI
ncbi:MAG: hypothetical protein HEQ13_05440 [Dolichospermum sp. DEX189]|nr:hypothetical protein [Dolichospermum sp. DEX189]